MQGWNPALKIQLEVPSILKPKKLWTGKQVINTLLNHIRGDFPGIYMQKKCRTPSIAWNGVNISNMDEHLIVRDNYICTGVLDKAQIGDGQSFGLVHAIHELYGAHACSTFLTAVGQLLSTFLQSHGFSARLGDLILTNETEFTRRRIIQSSFAKSIAACASAVNMANFDAHSHTMSEVITSVQEYLQKDVKNESRLDAQMRSCLATINNEVVSTCFPFGSYLRFPKNHFQVMILAGAKGSKVNMAQIVASLGQQELEGHRVPRMPSGKTLPSFLSFDPCARAGTTLYIHLSFILVSIFVFEVDL